MDLLAISTVFLICFSLETQGGLAQNSYEKQPNKERIKHGIFVPRDSNHGHGDEHNVEFDHEAIIGSTKEAREFDSLSADESKKRLAVLIKLMDRNKDSFVDKHELKAWILRSFRKLSEEEAADRFEEIDTDSDNKITWKEYLLDVYAMEDEDKKKDITDFDSYEEEQNMIRDDKQMFNAADKDNDGVLSNEEFVHFQNPEEYPEMLPIVLQHTLRDKDENKDGKIDFQEFIGNAAVNRDKEWLIVEKENFDKNFDTNNDGLLAGNEILKWIMPSNEEVAKDEVDHLFASTDEDLDDRLSYSEILNNHETFVGSEATEYGDHLQNVKHLADEL